MKIDFAGKKAIVCGGSRGIGKAIALGFAACGGDVSICARGPQALEETRFAIPTLGRKAHAASAYPSPRAPLPAHAPDPRHPPAPAYSLLTHPPPSHPS